MGHAEPADGGVDSTLYAPESGGSQTQLWKRSWMPFSSARSARVLLQMANYHDELLRDFCANPFRKRGVLAPLKELMARYQSSDYRDIASGAWRMGRD